MTERLMTERIVLSVALAFILSGALCAISGYTTAAFVLVTMAICAGLYAIVLQSKEIPEEAQDNDHPTV